MGTTEDKYHVNELSGLTKRPFLNPYHPVHRILILIFICLLNFGNYFCYDNPAALESTIKNDMKVSTSTYSFLYTIYSMPNVILSLFGGILIDKYLGIGWSTMLFASSCTIGQFVFALGGFFGHSGFWIMGLGRFIFGLGGENLQVCQNTYSVFWFKDSELNLVFGLQLSIARLGSSLNMNIMPHVYNAFGDIFSSSKPYTWLGFALLFGVLLCLLSFIFALLLWFFDVRASRIRCNIEGSQILNAKKGDEFHFKDIAFYPIELWLITIVCVAFYCTIFPFIDLGTGFYIGKFDYTTDQAALINSVVYLMSAVLSPVFGFLVDYFGFNIFWMLAGNASALIAHGLYGYTWLNPWIAVIFMGMGYSIIACALWPLPALFIPVEKLGTAYGIIQSMQNFGLAIVPTLSGKLTDNYGFMITEVFYVILLFVSIITTVMLYIIDGIRRQPKLNLNAISERRKQKKKAKEEEIDEFKNSVPHRTNNHKSSAHHESTPLRSVSLSHTSFYTTG